MVAAAITNSKITINGVNEAASDAKYRKVKRVWSKLYRGRK